MQGEHPDFPDAISFRLRVQRVVSRSRKEKHIERGDPVALFCGIGQPRRFQQTVKDLGAEVVSEWLLADHQVPRKDRLEEFVQKAKASGASYVLTTEKDAVKLPAHLRLALPLYYLEMQAEIVEGKRAWQMWIEKIRRQIDNGRHGSN
jgi:tetraacyldisaccharide 4'-kinase